MKKLLSLLLTLFLLSPFGGWGASFGGWGASFGSWGATPDTLWFKFDDRFTANEIIPLTDIDSVEFLKTSFKRYKTNASTGKATAITKSYRTDGQYHLDEIERYLVKPSYYSSIDFTNETSDYCFQRSLEGEHFIVFWAKGLTKQANGNLTGGASSSVCNVNTLLKNAEKIWNIYVDSLGFLVPGKSITDKKKIEMFVVNQSDWRADGSGTDGIEYSYSGTTKSSKSAKTGIFHCNAWAASSNVTVAHEIGHTFQYLISADLGMTHGLNYGFGSGASGGNEWWEDCANWQAHKVYPAEQFSENWGNNQAGHHRNILHEDTRYNNCYYQDWWCQKHGLNTIGRVWREATKPEDPVEAYMRIFGLDTQTFADEQYEGYAHIASMDIDRWNKYGQSYLGSEQQRLVEPSKTLLTWATDNGQQATDDGQQTTDNGQVASAIDSLWWLVDSTYCPQNYGYNANPLKIPAAGTIVKAKFKGIAGAPGFHAINTDYAGWRYGLVAYSSDGTRTYGEMGRDADGEVTLTVPDKCTNMWFVVMGAPTTYWRHPWDDNTSNDEQWPYVVKFENTDPLGASRTYGDYPSDYARKDTTVVINVNLPYSSQYYTYVDVKLDMDAISQALGISTAQMKAAACGKKTTKPYVRIAALNSNATTETNSKTISDSDVIFGNWFNSAGNVVGYTSTSMIYTKIYQDTYTCRVGQYPAHLTKGKTYTVRHAVIYTHTDGKEYKAIMELHVNVK